MATHTHTHTHLPASNAHEGRNVPEMINIDDINYLLQKTLTHSSTLFIIRIINNGTNNK